MGTVNSIRRVDQFSLTTTLRGPAWTHMDKGLHLGEAAVPCSEVWPDTGPPMTENREEEPWSGTTGGSTPGNPPAETHWLLAGPRAQGTRVERRFLPGARPTWALSPETLITTPKVGATRSYRPQPRPLSRQPGSSPAPAVSLVLQR